MYAVISYFNYRKEVSFSILKTFYSLNKAKKYAFEVANNEYGDEVVEGVSERWVTVSDEVIEGYTTGDGYGTYVFSVIEFDEPEDNE